MSDSRKEVEEDLRNSLIISENVLCERFPALKGSWAIDKIGVFIEVGLEIFKELRKKGVRK